MKRKLKVIADILLVLVMFVSAMPMQLVAEVMTLPLPVMQHRTGTTTMIVRKWLRSLNRRTKTVLETVRS